ncbi:MAG: DUF1801 domain-containing protein [Candidatus Acidiferrales bacterium]
MASASRARSVSARYASRKDPERPKLIRALRALVKKTLPRSSESVNAWGIPTFESDGPICYFMSGKSHITFGFPRGTSLPDTHGLLEGTGKTFRHVKLRALDDLRRPGLRHMILAASRLNKKERVIGMRAPIVRHIAKEK